MTLKKFFEEYITKKSIFLNKNAIQDDYTPEKIFYREKLIQQIAGVLAPVLKQEKPSNLFIYGKTGTGKTLSIQNIRTELLTIAEEKTIPLKILYINCKLKRVSDTEYRIIAELCRLLGTEVHETGLPTETVYKQFIKLINEKKQIVILVLDEIDQLVYSAGDEVLYSLTRLNSELTNSKISLIGISNDLLFRDNLDSRIKSSLSEEEILFPPYDAVQLQKILKDRAKLVFKEGSIEDGVLEKCAAHAAREHGDARRALELLRVAGELAERKNNQKISLEDLDEAQEKIERDRVLDAVEIQPKQYQAVLFAIFQSTKNAMHSQTESIFTGDIYDLYKDICLKSTLKPLTQRRLSDIIGELDMLGVIKAKVMSKGRYGRTRKIQMGDIPPTTLVKIEKILKDALF